MSILVVIGLIVIGAIVIAQMMRAARRAELMKKYNDAALVDRLMRRMFWEGQTQEQLIDSIGRPVQIDQKVLKSKTREIWKYNQTSKRRFGLRVTVEDGIVVGWDQKA